MIAYLHGKVVSTSVRSCILLTPGGVGYEVFLTEALLGEFRDMAEPEPETTLFVQTVVREDALDLYGFAAKAERDTFALLLSIHQLGPRTSLAVLSLYDPETLEQIVAEENVGALVRVPGIGEKTAKRLVWDLRDKLRKTVGLRTGPAKPAVSARTLYDDVLAGLINLGYREDEAASVLRGVLKEEPDLDVEGAIRAALKIMAGKRGS
jgi:holliday junction DNA helicase RuvA